MCPLMDLAELEGAASEALIRKSPVTLHVPNDIIKLTNYLRQPIIKIENNNSQILRDYLPGLAFTAFCG